MRPSLPPLDSASSSRAGPRSPDSTTQGHPSPLTPQSIPTRPYFLPADEVSEVQVFVGNGDRWQDVYTHFDRSPLLRPRKVPCVPPLSQDTVDDAFSCEAAHSTLAGPVCDPSRYSLLIHEVSLLVGLATDDEHPSPSDGCSVIPNEARLAPDILPLNLTPNKSFPPREHGSAGLPCSNDQVHLANILASSTIDPLAGDAGPSPHSENLLPVRPRHHIIPIARYQSADAGRPSLSSRRRQGQVFHSESPFNNTHHRNALFLDETFSNPREPPPTPTPKLQANRCSSLDRLECSLRKLEAHAPGHHRKSQSEGLSFDHVTQRRGKRPSLPPSRRLRKPQSTHEVMPRNPSRPIVDYHFSGPPLPASSSVPLYQYVVPQNCPTIILDNERCERDLTPSSFMDMDIPLIEEVSQKRPASFSQVTTKEKVKSLVRVARRVSRGVVAWGKSLAGSTKPPATGKEATAIQSTRV